MKKKGNIFNSTYSNYNSDDNTCGSSCFDNNK